MPTILITGANGFVGYYLTLQLLQQSYKVIATGKGENRLPFTDANFVYESLDFTDEENIKAVFEKYRPDVVIHGGAISKPDECELHKEKAYLINVTGTELLLQQATVYQSFFVFISTDFVFSGEEKRYKEEDATGPVNYYGQTKVLAEAAVRQYPHDWSIVRTVL